MGPRARMDKSFALPDHPACSLVTILTKLFWILPEQIQSL